MFGKNKYYDVIIGGDRYRIRCRRKGVCDDFKSKDEE